MTTSSIDGDCATAYVDEFCISGRRGVKGGMSHSRHHRPHDHSNFPRLATTVAAKGSSKRSERFHAVWRARLWPLFILLLVPACAPQVGRTTTSEKRSGGCAEGLINEQCVVQLSSGVYDFGGAVRPFSLLKVAKQDGSPAYIQWFPPLLGDETRAGALLLARPYSGIAWSDDLVDQRWAAEHPAPGCYPDIDGPDYNPQTSAPHCYFGTIPPEQAAIDAASLLENGVGVLLPYGRFYAGGSIGGYVDTMIAGLQFLGDREDVDPQRVAVMGTSLGGMQGFHAADPSRLPDGAAIPSFGVGVAPLLDLKRQTSYLINDIPARLAANPEQQSKYQEFFEPFLRRFFATTGGPPGDAAAEYTKWTVEHLVENLRGDFLVFHDTWDTLVPSLSSEILVDAGVAEGFWFPHQTEIDFNGFALEHQQPAEGLTYSVTGLFSQAFLLERLAPEKKERILLYDYRGLETFFAYIRDQQLAGENISWLVPRLLEVATPEVLLLDTENNVVPAYGYHIIGLFLNELWQAALQEDNFATEVLAFLQSAGLPR